MEKTPALSSILKNNHEDLNLEIKEKVLKAMENAPDLETIQLMEISKNNETKINELLEKSTVSVENLHEYRLILRELKLTEEEIKDLLAHKNAHANKADNLGAKHLNYTITILRNNDGSYLYQPYTRIYIPEDWSDDKLKDSWKKIAMAPEEYGNKLSTSDIEMAQQ